MIKQSNVQPNQLAMFFGLVALSGWATPSLAATVPPDPAMIKGTTAYIDSITKLVKVPGPQEVADSTAKWVGNFVLQTGRYSDLAGSYLIPYTGTDFNVPIPTKVTGEVNSCLKHLNRMRDIAAALSRGRWSGTTRNDALNVLQKGMDYWVKINPYSYYNADGTLRYAIDPVKTTGSYTKLMDYGSIVSDILLTSRSLVGTGSPITSEAIQKWALMIEDTTLDAKYAGRSGITYDQGTNWWWRLNSRVARNWTIDYYKRADDLIFAACDSVKLTYYIKGTIVGGVVHNEDIAEAGTNYWISGLRPDGTYNQHGAAYNGQYGQGGINSIMNFGKIVAGTGRYGLTETAKHVLIDHILDGSGRLSYRGAYSPDVEGRYFTQRYFGAPYTGKRLSDYNGYMPYLTGLKYRQNELDALTAWSKGGKFPWPEAPAKVFPFGDLATWLRSDAGVFWKGVSKRLFRTESYDNGEDAGNRLVLQMGLGVHWILANDGSQYNGNFMAVMDPSALPGTTSDSFDIPVWPAEKVRIPGLTSFDGGVSDGRNMALAYDLDLGAAGSTEPGRVLGKKAVFFLDSAVVSLAAGMKWDRPTDVRTTLNQLNQSGSFLVSRQTGSTVTETEFPAGTPNSPVTLNGTNIRWAWHDDVGYVLPPNLSATVESEVRTASPSRAGLGINGVKLPANVTATVASVWLSHGKKNVNTKDGDAFWYAFYPGMTKATFQTEANRALKGDVWTIDTNTANIQAISVPAKSWHGAIFHSPGTVTTKAALPFVYGVSRPCALLVRITSDRLILSLSDPAQGTAPVTVTLGVELENINYDKVKKVTSLVLQPSARPDSAGMTVQYIWKLKTIGISRTAVSPALVQARLLPGAGIVVAGPSGTYQVEANDINGRSMGAWNVTIPSSGRTLIPLRSTLAKWIVTVKS